MFRFVRAALAAATLLPVVGCANAVGADFSGYTARECSPVAQDCASGMHCRFDATSSTIGCTDQVGGDSTLDVACDTEDECGDGYACARFDANQTSHCSKYCTADDDCGADRACVPFSTPRYMDDAQTASVGVCAPRDPVCDPFTTSQPPQCAAGQRCTVVDSQYTVCDPIASGAGIGQACASRNDCQQGAVCLTQNGGKTFVCERVCRVGVSGACPTGKTCVGYAPAVMVGSDAVGACE